jgi:hypothetical protein
MRKPLPPPAPPPRIYREGVGFLPYRGVSPLVWKTIQLINDDRLKDLK